jgi:hypothetical protein
MTKAGQPSRGLHAGQDWIISHIKYSASISAFMRFALLFTFVLFPHLLILSYVMMTHNFASVKLDLYIA